jgi:hypothetical protein
MSGFLNPQNVKVGDSVFVTDDNIGSEYLGTHGIIEQIDTSDNGLPLFVRFTSQDGRSRVYWVREGHYSLTVKDDGPVPADMSLLKKGDTVVIFGRNDQYDGKEAEFVGRDGDGDRYQVKMDGQALYFFSRQIALPQGKKFGDYTLPENMTLDEAVAIIERIANDHTEVKTQRDVQERRAKDAETRLNEQQRRYSHDMGAIQIIMREQKSEQDWCDDGYNRVVRQVNGEMEGGWEFEEFRSLVRKTVTVRGETTTDIEVWVHDGDDEDDPDNWLDEDGDEIGDADALMQEELQSEFRRCGEFDTVEVQ